MCLKTLPTRSICLCASKWEFMLYNPNSSCFTSRDDHKNELKLFWPVTLMFVFTKCFLVHYYPFRYSCQNLRYGNLMVDCGLYTKKMISTTNYRHLPYYLHAYTFDLLLLLLLLLLFGISNEHFQLN